MTTSRRTKAIHAATRRSQYGELSEAIFLTQGFDYPSAESAAARFEDIGPDEFIYARYGNPTNAMFEDRMAQLEGVEAGFATASGMAAVNAALMGPLKAGDHVVAARALFGSCLYVLEDILGRFGVEITLVDGTDLPAWKAALRSDTKAVFFESLSNPTLEVVDIAGVSKLAHDVGALVIADNVFTTPTYSKAAELGVDIIVYSTTKHIDGQGRALGGIVLTSNQIMEDHIAPYLKHTGGAMSPFTAWMMLKGLETLDLRVREQTRSAGLLADALAGSPAVQRVIYPGRTDHPQADLVQAQMGAGGTMLAIDMGDRAQAFAMMNALNVAKISNNLGDAKTIATHPATTTHKRLSDAARAAAGITDGLVRISVGLEDVDDLIQDFAQAIG
ncbi:MAG: O-succinylhomoserine sulfhydrylase [Planktomarina sp.]